MPNARNVAINTIGTGNHARPGIKLKLHGQVVMAGHILPVVIPVLPSVRKINIIVIMIMAALNTVRAVWNAVWLKRPIRIACPAVTDEC